MWAASIRGFSKCLKEEAFDVQPLLYLVDQEFLPLGKDKSPGWVRASHSATSCPFVWCPAHMEKLTPGSWDRPVMVVDALTAPPFGPESSTPTTPTEF